MGRATGACLLTKCPANPEFEFLTFSVTEAQLTTNDLQPRWCSSTSPCSTLPFKSPKCDEYEDDLMFIWGEWQTFVWTGNCLPQNIWKGFCFWVSKLQVFSDHLNDGAAMFPMCFASRSMKYCYRNGMTRSRTLALQLDCWMKQIDLATWIFVSRLVVARSIRRFCVCRRPDWPLPI